MLVENLVSDRIKVGIVTANIDQLPADHTLLEDRLARILSQRREDLGEQKDAFRKACRDMMRIGSYKPTGRGKPASEYLLRTASEGNFPRINSVVDINNYISLKYLVPISLWDTDKIDADSWLFRPGGDEESFVFNSSGQTIQLHDLITGFAVKDGQESPIVTPVKDCQQTKTDRSTSNIMAAVYYPAHWTNSPSIEEILEEFNELLTFN
ncbi:MAG: hypothetical protein JJU37_01540 [Balneolaceae bacterium]|nr:hypothetical protein [Balneolaceae bacterium]